MHTTCNICTDLNCFGASCSQTMKACNLQFDHFFTSKHDGTLTIDPGARAFDIGISIPSFDAFALMSVVIWISVLADELCLHGYSHCYPATVAGSMVRDGVGSKVPPSANAPQFLLGRWVGQHFSFEVPALMQGANHFWLCQAFVAKLSAQAGHRPK